jgi:hypothetical protein
MLLHCWNSFWQECFIFCNMVHHVPAKFKTYFPVVWRVRLQSKMFSKNFLHTWLWYIQLTACLTCWLLGLSDKLTEHDLLFPHSYSVGLNSSPYRCNLCPQIFHTTFWLHLRLENPFQTFFWILPEQLSETALNEKLQHIKSFFQFSQHLCCMLVARVEITSYACAPTKKKKGFLSCLLQLCVFTFCVVITFLPINLCNCSHHV